MTTYPSQGQTDRHAVLSRVAGQRRAYVLEGVGTLQMKGWTMRAATATAGELSWQIARRGVIHPVFQAADSAGDIKGALNHRGRRRGGVLLWSGRELELRPDSIWRERYVLSDADRPLASIEGKAWGKRPENLIVHETTIDPGLLLFAVFIVCAIAEDNAAASVTIAAAA